MSVKIKLLLTCLVIFSNLIYAHKVTPTSVGAYLSGSKIPGSTITFTGASSHDNDSQNGGKQIYWEWDFDYNGSFNSSGYNVSSTKTHIYASAGVKTIAVRYTDNDGQIGAIYSFQLTIADEAKYYYAKDHLGSIRQTWDKNGNIVAAQDYYSYGEIIAGRSYNNGTAYERFKPACRQAGLQKKKGM